MRKFKVNESLLDSLRNVLTRRAISFTIKTENDGIFCYTDDLSGRAFHKCVVRAKCEQVTRDKKSSIPYIAHNELNDRLVLQEIGPAYLILPSKES